MGQEIKLEHLLEIEKKYNLYQDKIENVPYWIYSRFDIWENIIMKESMGLEAAHIGRTRMSDRIGIYMHLLFNSIFRKNIKKQPIVFLYNSSARTYKNGYYVSEYTDYIEKLFPDNLILESPYLLEHVQPIENKNVFFLDYILLQQEVYYRICKTLLKKKYKSYEEQVTQRVEAPLTELEELWGLKINRKKIKEEVVKHILSYKVGIKLVEKLVNNLNPKLLIEIVSYSPISMMFNEVCARKEIPTIELQHGIMNKHISYSYYSRNRILQLPKKIFLFSDFWREQVVLPLKEEELPAVGFYSFDEGIRKSKKIDEFDDGKKNILFISQGPIGKKLCDLAIKLSEKIDANEYRILYKLHPGEVVKYDEYKVMEQYGIVVLHTKEYSLYDLFASSEIQIGVYSTALYEGLGFGLDTYIYKIEQSDYMSELCRLGYAHFIENEEELEYLIKKNKEKNEGNKGFWKTTSLDDVKKLIENVFNN